MTEPSESASEQSSETANQDKHKRDLARTVLQELRSEKEKPFVPTADIDIVWVLSAPGTVKQVSEDGVYKGASSDLTNINHGIELVQQITALRLGKEVNEVTKEDVGAHGPTLFYNGEDESTSGTKYPQNKDFAELISTPDFPIPSSRIVIDHIDQANSIAQVESIARYLKDHQITGKVATVSIGAHFARMGRYLELHKDIFPEGVEFLNAAATQTHNPVGTTLREIRKVVQYEEKGDLAEKSYFKNG